MSSRAITSENPDNITEYYPFPKDPSLIRYDTEYAYKYLEPFEVNRITKRLAERIIFSQYDAVLVNMVGGFPLFKDLATRNGFTGAHIEIEYHRPDDGIGSRIVKPVPEFLRNKKCLVIDDIADRKTTFISILEILSDQSMCVALVTKRDIPNQEYIKNIMIGAELDNKWLAGKGMNIDYTGDQFYKPGAFRNYGGIVARPPNEVLLQLA